MKQRFRSSQSTSQVDIYIAKYNQQQLSQSYKPPVNNTNHYTNLIQAPISLKQQQRQLQLSILEAKKSQTQHPSTKLKQVELQPLQIFQYIATEYVDQKDKDIHMSVLRIQLQILISEKFDLISFIINNFMNIKQNLFKQQHVQSIRNQSILRNPDQVFEIITNNRRRSSQYFPLLPNMNETLTYIDNLKKNRILIRNLSIDTAVESVNKLTNKFIQTIKK